MQAGHRAVRDRDHPRRLSRAPLLQGGCSRSVAVVPCRLDQDTAHVAVTGLRDAALAFVPTAGVLAGYHAEEGHHSTRRREGPEGVQFRDYDHRRQGVDAAETPQRGHWFRVRRLTAEILELLRQRLQTIHQLVDREQIVVEYGLVYR